MTNQEWLPEEVEHLRRVVQRVLVKGGNKTLAFKEFAKESKLRTETAARYKWITISSACESEDCLQSAEKEKGLMLGSTTAHVDRFSITSDIREILHKYGVLLEELDELKSQVKRLRHENVELKKENDQFVKVFQLARQHLNPNLSSYENNFTVRVGRDGVVESVSANC